MALYRVLVRHGASETEAEAAASVDTSQLVTKADLLAALADVKASMQMWMITALIAQTALLLIVLRGMRP
jgi:hypothetical protein